MKLTILWISLLVQSLLPGAQGSSGVISGRIAFPDGRGGGDVLVVAVPATVQATSDRAVRASALVDEAGNYRIEDVPPGRYFIQTRWTEPETYYPGVIETQRAAPVEVLANTTVKDLNFAVTAPGFKVSGHVFGLDPARQGRGRNATTVQITGPRRFSGTVGIDGNFEFPRVPPGDYTMLLSVSGAEGMETPLRVIDRDVAGIELRAPASVLVQGTVEYVSGGPPSTSGVTFTFSDGVRPIAVSTNADGTFGIGLPPGEYRVSLRGILSVRDPDANARNLRERSGESGYLRSLKAESLDLTASTLRIAAGVQPPVITAVIDVSAGVDARGRVTMDGAGIPPESTITMIDRMVNRTYGGPPQPRSAPILADGSFRFTKVMPGNYALRVSIGGALPTAPVPVVIPNHDVDDLVIPAGKPTVIRGAVVTEGLHPGPPISLVIFQGSRDLLSRSDPFAPPFLSRRAFNLLREDAEAGRTYLVTLDIDPRRGNAFQFALPAGEYQVALNSETRPIPPAFSLSTLACGAANLLTEPLRVADSADAELLLGLRPAAPETWVKVSGRLTGRLTGQYRVRMEEAVTLETAVNTDGTFAFADVPPALAAYTVTVVPPIPGVAALNIPVRHRDIDSVDFAIPTLKKVSGHVTVDGRGAAPGFLRLTLKNKSHITEIGVRPDAAGQFTVDLPVGGRLAVQPTFVKAFSSDLRSATLNGVNFLGADSPAIRDDGPDEIRLELSEEASLPMAAVRGRVTGEDIRPDGLRVELISVAQFHSFAATVTPDGSFAFDRIPQGTYQIALTGAADLTWAPLMAAFTGPNSRIDIALQQGRTAGRSVSLVTKSAPVATIRDAGSGAVGGADESAAAVANLRTINTAQVTYLSTSGGNYGNLSQLIDAGFLSPDLAKELRGYSYSIVAEGGDYVATAVPASTQPDNHAFFTTPDGVIRYSAAESLAPQGEQGRPVQ